MDKDKDKDIEIWWKELVKCIRCGTCRSVCPVFQTEINENVTARGKIRLIEAVADGQFELTEEMQKRVFKCLMCKACAGACGSGVNTGDLFLQARKVLAKKHGVPLVKKLTFTGMTYRKLFDLGLRTGAAFQGAMFKDSPDGRGKIARIPLPSAGLSARRIIPPLATKPLRSRLSRVNTVENPKARVAFFPGCMLSYIYPETGEAIVAILRENGVEVVLPEELYCCGTPAFINGDFGVGQFLAGKNVTTLAAEPFDAIITGCASCGYTLKHEYGLIIDDPATKETWQKLSEKVYDITQYLIQFGYSKTFGKIDAKVTYHDPCHLVRGMGVSKEPREVIRAIPGVELVEMKDANRCCGAGGTFSLAYYDIARKVNDEKLDTAENTGTSILLTGCSLCRMHITDGLSQRASKMQVMHTAEFIARAYRAGK